MSTGAYLSVCLNVCLFACLFACLFVRSPFSNAKTLFLNARTPFSNAKTPFSSARIPFSNARTPFSNAKTQFSNAHGRTGLILFGGGAKYSLPEQANCTLIFLPKIVGERGGGSPKIVFRTYHKKFSGHTKYFSRYIRKFCRTFQKIFPNIT